MVKHIAALFFVGTALLAELGCNSVLGIDDHQLAPPDIGNQADAKPGGQHSDASTEISRNDGPPDAVEEAGPHEAGSVDVFLGSGDAGIAESSVDAVEETTATCPTGMVLVKGGGSFKPGSGVATTVADFCLDVVEVTTGAFAKCVTDNLCDLIGVNVAADPRCFYGKAGKENYPMDCVATTAATAYCQKTGKRLPSEAEWEWAARGGPLSYTYPWGTETPNATSTRLCWSQNASAASL